MKAVQVICAIFIVVAWALTGCANPVPSQDANKTFDEMYTDCSMNEILRLSLMPPSYSGDEDWDLLLENISDTSVRFPAGFNLKLMSFDNEQNRWVETGNNFQYLPLDAKYIVGKNDPKAEYPYMLIRIEPSIGKEINLRVVVRGQAYKKGVETEECIGAFVDIEYIP